MLITILILLVSISCTTTNTALIEEVSIVPKNVEIVITTNIQKFNEIIVSYKGFDIEEQWIYAPRQFNCDSNGNQEPIIILFPEYRCQEIVGNALRNNKAHKHNVYGLYCLRIVDSLCRKEGIRTLDTLPYTHFPGVRLRPLGHLSNLIYKYNSINPSGAVT